mmetsp:Transcript_9124/g.28281  ORF Transcript_9124/g.28281 Transcript_9124/m.28281 type:complete len:221 (+) Transcript_9124:2052-2714(+)
MKACAPSSFSPLSALSNASALLELNVERPMYPTRSPLSVVTSGPHSAERTGSSVMTRRSTSSSTGALVPSLITPTDTFDPGAPCRRCAISYSDSPAVDWPPMDVTTSPLSIPASAAGPPATGATTVSTPSPAFKPLPLLSPSPLSSLKVISSPTPLTLPVVLLLMVAYASGVRKRVNGSPSCASMSRMASYVCSRVLSCPLLSTFCRYVNQLTPLKFLST